MSPWVRIDENAMEHPKIGGLSDGAFRLWVQTLAYCQKYLTNGLVSSMALKGLRAFSSKRRNELIVRGLWAEDVEGISVHDYLDWNDSRDRVLATRQAARERVARLRGKSSVTSGERSPLQRENRSGGVVWVGNRSAGEAEGKGGVGEKPLTERAGAFSEWYGETHERLIGVAYIGNPQRDYSTSLEIVGKFSDQDARDAALVWFGMDDDFARNGTRTIPKFASRASDCLLRARKVSA